MAQPSNRPTLVVLGASGDLAARLLFPALLSLEHRERLEDLRIIGYARQEWNDDQFHENLRAAIDLSGTHYDDKYLDRDAVFGVRAGLALPFERATDRAALPANLAARESLPLPVWTVTIDIRLPPP